MPDSSMRLSPMPSDTAHATKAVFNLTNAYLIIGDQAEQWLRKLIPTDQLPALERSPIARTRLAFLTIFQFAENLPDRLAADAVRTRLDWKYALHLPLNGPGFDYTALREYRQSVVRSPSERRMLQGLIEQVATTGLLPLTERQNVGVDDVLIAVGNLGCIEDLFEALRAALVVLAARWPDWLRHTALPHWYERYTRQPEIQRLPHDRSEQESLAKTIGEDAAHLLEAINGSQLDGASNLAEIRWLRKLWPQQFVVDQGGLQWRGAEV